MRSLCTLSDKNYLLQGLTLYFSLLKSSNDTFTLVNLNKTTLNSYILDLTKINNKIELVKFDWKQSLRKIINKNKPL